MSRPADALLITLYRMWDKLSFAVALVVVLVASPFILPIVFLYQLVQERWGAGRSRD